MWTWLQYAFLAVSVAEANMHGPTSGGMQPSTPRTITIPNALACADLRCVVLQVIDKLILFAYPILTLLILWGGFQILTAGGSSERVTSGRKTIQWAVIGFVLILLAKGFAAVIADVIGVGGNAGATQSVLTSLDRLIGWVFTFFMVAAVFMVLYAAYLYLTAGGESEKVTQANRTLLYGAIAIAIAVLSKSIPIIVKNFVQNDLSRGGTSAPLPFGFGPSFPLG